MQNKVDKDVLDSFRDKCRQHGLKLTAQRLAIYRELTRSRNHPSADTIFRAVRRKFPSISFDTVYRTLLTFCEIGILDVVEGHGDPRRFDPNLEAHHHFRCQRCSEIIDFSSRPFDRLEIPQEIQKRFTVLKKRVVLQGICNRCISKHG